MLDSPITLHLSPELYQRAQNLATETAQSLEGFLLGRLEHALNDPLADLPLSEQTELNALTYLADDTLWTIAREKMPLLQQDRMQILMDKNNFGEISAREYAELADLVEQGQRLMLRKAQASFILTQRGQKVTPDDLND